MPDMDTCKGASAASAMGSSGGGAGKWARLLKVEWRNPGTVLDPDLEVLRCGACCVVLRATVAGDAAELGRMRVSEKLAALRVVGLVRAYGSTSVALEA